MKKILLPIFIAVFALGLASVVFAQDPWGGGSTGSGITLMDPLECEDFLCVSDKIIDFLFTLAMPLTAILVLVGGFQMITAGGSPEKFSAGKKTIIYAAIGFAVVLLAKGVVGFIQDLLK